MSWHVIRTFCHMPEDWITVGHKAGHKRLEILSDQRISVLAKRKRSASMQYEYIAKPLTHAGGTDHLHDLPGQIVGTSTWCSHR